MTKKYFPNLAHKLFLGFFVLLTGQFLEFFPILFAKFAESLLPPIFYSFDLVGLPVEQKKNYASFLMKTIGSIPTPLLVWGLFIFLTPLIISLLFRRKKILLTYFWLSTGFDQFIVDIVLLLSFFAGFELEVNFAFYYLLALVLPIVIIRSVGFLLSLVFINKLEQKRLTTEKYY